MSLAFDDLRKVTVYECIKYPVCASTIRALCRWPWISSSYRSFRRSLQIYNSQLVEFALGEPALLVIIIPPRPVT